MVIAKCQARLQNGRSRIVPTTKPIAMMEAHEATTTNRKMM